MISKWLFAQSPLVVYVPYNRNTTTHSNGKICRLYAVQLLGNSSIHVYSLHHTICFSLFFRSNIAGIRPYTHLWNIHEIKKSEQHLGHLQCIAWREYPHWVSVGLAAAVAAVHYLFFSFVFYRRPYRARACVCTFLFLLSFILCGIFLRNIRIRSLSHSHGNSSPFNGNILMHSM